MKAVRRIALNALSILGSDVAVRAATFVIYALVARYLGPYEFGQMSLALAFFYPAQVLAALGLKPLLTRQVARRLDHATTYVVNGVTLAVGASIVAFGLVALIVRLLGYSADTAAIILLTATALIPFSVSAVCEATFQAMEKMRLIAYAQVPANVAKAAAAYLLLEQQAGMTRIVALIVGVHVLVMVIECGLLLRVLGVVRVRPTRPLMTSLLADTRPFLGIDGLVALGTSANVIILSQFVGESDVALFSSTVQMMTPIGLVITSVVLSFFPVMARRYERSADQLRSTTTLLLGILMVILVPAAMLLIYLAEPILLLLYRDPEFAAAAYIVRMASVGVLFTAASVVLGQALVAANRERVNVSLLAAETAIGLVTGVVLISYLGVLGAALTALTTQVVKFGLHYVMSIRYLGPQPVDAVVWPKLLAGGAMVSTSLIAGQRHIILGVLAGVTVYALVLAVSESAEAGGLQQVRLKYARMWQ